jgi:hypothetical protein
VEFPATAKSARVDFPAISRAEETPREMDDAQQAARNERGEFCSEGMERNGKCKMNQTEGVLPVGGPSLIARAIWTCGDGREGAMPDGEPQAAWD